MSLILKAIFQGLNIFLKKNGHFPQFGHDFFYLHVIS